MTLERAKIFDDEAGKLGPQIGRDGVERTRLTDSEFQRLAKLSKEIKIECDCHFSACKTCRQIGKMKWYSEDYRITKALIDELAGYRKEWKVPRATLEEIIPGVVWLNFEDSWKMCFTFLRFQEHYESPEYAGKYFTLEEFKEWYQEDDEEFTYCEDWGGFNIPSWVLDPFLEGKFNPLSREEEWFLSLFRERKQQDDKFYIIVTYGDLGEEEALKHETDHGLFYVNPSYKEEVREALKGLEEKTVSDIREALAPDYHETSLEDEIHAYTMEKLSAIRVEVTEDVRRVSSKLCEIYDKYWKEANGKSNS